jgi:hypothetical protein
MCTAGLLTKVKLWNQPRCLSVDKWIKTYNLCTMENDSAIKKSEIMTFAGKWTDWRSSW